VKPINAYRSASSSARVEATAGVADSGNAAVERWGEWEPCIGIEVHAQVASISKAFSTAETVFAATPNTKVAPFDCGMPGALPVLNTRCVEVGCGSGLPSLLPSCTHSTRSLARTV
jgi:hypothetical protein